MTIKAIETHYAGCRDRSRLEARWAVFFDALGIEWQYELEGYWVSPGWGDPHDETHRVKYLPDFWLPEFGWVEVKGYLNQPALEKMCYAACPDDGLPSRPDGSRPDDPSRCGNRLLVLGDIPRDIGTPGSGLMPSHARLWWHKGELFQRRVSFYVGNSSNSPGGGVGLLDEGNIQTLVWDDSGTFHHAPGHCRSLLASPLLSVSWILGDRLDCSEVREAYKTARAARFEHGESG